MLNFNEAQEILIQKLKEASESQDKFDKDQINELYSDIVTYDQ